MVLVPADLRSWEIGQSVFTFRIFLCFVFEYHQQIIWKLCYFTGNKQSRKEAEATCG